MTRWFCLLRSEVVMRTKSSPVRAKIVATPPVALAKRSTASKWRFSACLPARSDGVFCSPMATVLARSSSRAPVGSMSSKTLPRRRVPSLRVTSYIATDCCISRVLERSSALPCDSMSPADWR
ncbi:putative secreted protein [Xanthomonas bromi]|uniref:Putative secreted protein n=1 Tax=Xanthomonas bromi TaxID=56449 RepID=A0A1C3NNX8_9XANT|nr:putative secreted protein [Xanthomonas bromi]